MDVIGQPVPSTISASGCAGRFLEREVIAGPVLGAKSRRLLRH
jgi:hypothetical protein